MMESTESGCLCFFEEKPLLLCFYNRRILRLIAVYFIGKTLIINYLAYQPSINQVSTDYQLKFLG